MNTQPNNSANSANSKSTNNTQPTQEIDLMALLGALLDRKYFIVVVTALFMFVGVIYAVLSTPVYQATAMIQVEDGGASVPGFDDMAGMFESTISSANYKRE